MKLNSYKKPFNLTVLINYKLTEFLRRFNLRTYARARGSLGDLLFGIVVMLTCAVTFKILEYFNVEEFFWPCAIVACIVIFMLLNFLFAR